MTTLQTRWRGGRQLVSEEIISISPDKAGAWLVELEDTGFLDGEMVLDTMAVRHHAFGRWLRASVHNRVAFMRVWDARQRLNEVLVRAPDDLKDVASRTFMRKLMNTVAICMTFVALGAAAISAYIHWR